MAEPDYRRPITRAQVTSAREWREAAKRKAEAAAKKRGQDPAEVKTYKVNQQDVVDTYGPRSWGNWGRDFWGLFGQAADQLWNGSRIPQTWRRFTEGKYPWNANSTITGEDDYEEKIQTGYAPHQLTRQQAIDRYLHFAKRDEDPEKDELHNYLIPAEAFNQRGGIDSKWSKVVKAKFNRYMQDARRKGAKASLSRFMAFNMPQVAREQLEAQAEVPSYGGFWNFMDTLAAAHQAQSANARAFSGDFEGAAESYKKSGQMANRVAKQYEELDPAQKVQYWTSPFAITAGGILGAKAAPKLLPGLIAWQAVRYPTSKLLHGGADLITQDNVALGNAMVNGNIYLLNEKLKDRLKIIQEEYGLPEYSQDPKVQYMYAQVGAGLLNRAARWHKGAQITADFVPAVFSPSQAVRAGGKIFARQAAKKGTIAAGKKALKAVARDLPKAVVVPTAMDAAYVAYGTTRPTQPLSFQHQVVRGQIPMEEYGRMLEDQNLPNTLQNRIALGKSIKAEEQIAASPYNGQMGTVAANLGNNWIRSSFDKDIEDRIALAGMSEGDLEKALPQFIRNQQTAQADPRRQAIFRKWRQNPENREYVKTKLQSLSPKQYLQLLNLNKKRAQKQGPYLPSKTAQQNTAWITSVAMQAATDNYRNLLAEKDSDKFYQGMQQWMPLIKALGGSDQNSPLRKATKEAVWNHVKRNPFFINKAMSIWAMSNGFNSLAAFLGSNGSFYGTLATLGLGLPLTISLMRSMFGGGGSAKAPQQSVQQSPVQGYRPMAYAPKADITRPGLIV